MGAMLALLFGAAAPPNDISDAAACMLTKIGADYAYHKLSITGTEEDDEGEGPIGKISHFAPAGNSVLGNPAATMTAFDYVEDGRGTLRLEATAPGDYARARATLLQLHGKAKCDSEVGGAGQRTCEIMLSPKGEWKRTARLFEGEGTLQTTCVYSTD